MIRSIPLAFAIGVAFAQPAGAQSPMQPPEAPAAASPAAQQGSATRSVETPATVDDCLKRVNAVIGHALTLNLPNDKVEQAETALATMEQSCVEQRFTEASATESDIRRIIAAQGGPTGDGK